VSVFRFIATRKAEHSVKTLCRVLGVSRSGFHAWERRAPSDRELADAWLGEQIRAIHDQSRQTYGARRVHAALRHRGVRVGRKRVERLMRTLRLSGLVPKRYRRTTIRVPGVRVADDLVERDFNPSGPNQLWVADIKYVRSWQGWLYLAAVVDCYSRRVVGWSMRTDLEAELVVDALEMAVARRRPRAGLVHHSDQGSQGGFNWSSQHLVMEVVRDGCWQASAGDSSDARADVVAGPAVGGAAGGSAAFLAGDRGWVLKRGRGRRGGRFASGWQPVVPRRWRDAANLVGPAVGALSVVR
jgi:putative transposase